MTVRQNAQILNDFGFIIPTKDRPNQLNRLLESIFSQDALPACIVIVDGSEQSVELDLLKHPPVRIIYLRHLPPSLTAQRNRGIAALPQELVWAGFLDDDLQLLPGAISSAYAFIQANSRDLGGLSFNIVNERGYNGSWLLRLLFLAGQGPGTISRAGCAGNNCNVQEDTWTNWLCGGATIWRTQVFRDYAFDEWFRGYALWEDVDFSFRVSKVWKLAVVKNAPVLHLHEGFPTMSGMRRVGDVEIVDRFYFVDKHKESFSRIAVTISGLGTIAGNVARFIVKRNIMFLPRAWANLQALVRCSLGRIERGR